MGQNPCFIRLTPAFFGKVWFSTPIFVGKVCFLALVFIGKV